jgi:hypothetical protein
MSIEDTPGSGSVTWTSNRQEECQPDLRLLHFNDVYHIECVLFSQLVS